MPLHRLSPSVVPGVVAAILVVAIAWGLWPPRIVVDTRVVTHGPLTVHVADDGVTRIRDRYVITAPLAGKATRIEHHPGDPVEADVTVVCAVEPTDPALLDPRAVAEAEAAVEAARGEVARADAAEARAGVTVEYASADLERARTLAPDRVISHERLDEAERLFFTAQEDLRAAGHAAAIARWNLAAAQAALLKTRPGLDDTAGGGVWHMELRSPVSGRLLRVFHESAGPVTPGTALAEVGDPRDLEIVIDLVSEDAAKVRAGDRARIDAWGGGEPLRARVRVVEPRGFLKVSPLGVEEQRVNVILDLISPPEERPTLGDDFRVEARIEIDRIDDAVLVPVSALFRHGHSPAVYVVERGRARLTTVELGRRGDHEAEVVGGLAAGDVVVEYPADDVRDGVAVRPR